MASLVDLGITAIVDSASNLVNSLGNQIRGNQPVDLAKLAELEVKLAELKSTAEKNAVDDRKSARELEAKYADKGTVNYLQQFLGYGAIFMLAFVIFALFRFDIKPDVNNLLMIVVGGLLKIVYDLYGFYFGSSAGSDAKNTMISGLLDKFKK